VSLSATPVELSMLIPTDPVAVPTVTGIVHVVPLPVGVPTVAPVEPVPVIPKLAAVNSRHRLTERHRVVDCRSSRRIRIRTRDRDHLRRDRVGLPRREWHVDHRRPTPDPPSRFAFAISRPSVPVVVPDWPSPSTSSRFP
jgi:hypothetical protein